MEAEIDLKDAGRWTPRLRIEEAWYSKSLCLVPDVEKVKPLHFNTEGLRLESQVCQKGHPGVKTLLSM